MILINSTRKKERERESGKRGEEELYISRVSPSPVRPFVRSFVRSFGRFGLDMDMRSVRIYRESHEAIFNSIC